jgi:hypothetical protein
MLMPEAKFPKGPALSFQDSPLLIFTHQKPPAAATRGQDSLANRPRAWDDRRLFLREHLYIGPVLGNTVGCLCANIRREMPRGDESVVRP